MAGVFHKFLRKSQSLRLITSFAYPQSSNLRPTFFLNETLLSENKPADNSNPCPLSSSVKRENVTHFTSSLIFPSFPFVYHSNPISAVEFYQSEAEDMESGGSQTIWADSVKRKRKRKMNKHKYQKRRKLLRRKT